jgi:hypothetical protein
VEEVEEVLAKGGTRGATQEPGNTDGRSASGGTNGRLCAAGHMLASTMHVLYVVDICEMMSCGSVRQISIRPMVSLYASHLPACAAMRVSSKPTIGSARPLLGSP